MISPSTIASASGAETPQFTSLYVLLDWGSSSTALIAWLPMSSPTRDCFFPKSISSLPESAHGLHRFARLDRSPGPALAVCRASMFLGRVLRPAVPCIGRCQSRLECQMPWGRAWAENRGARPRYSFEQDDRGRQLAH